MLEAHPLAEVYPLMKQADIDRIVEDMRCDGWDSGCPITMFEGKILDGRNRYLAASLAGVDPSFTEFRGTVEEAQQFVRKRNEERRHLEGWWLSKHRAEFDPARNERRARILALRAEGTTIAEIAAKTKVSTGTVKRDIKIAIKEAPHLADSLPDKVKSKNGRLYPRERINEKASLCDRVERVSAGHEVISVAFSSCTVLLDKNSARLLARTLLRFADM